MDNDGYINKEEMEYFLQCLMAIQTNFKFNSHQVFLEHFEKKQRALRLEMTLKLKN